MGNNERNNYVKEAIIRATIGLLKERNLSEISISDITDKADVSRNSFYRNFSDKADILREHIRKLLEDWDYEYNHTRKSDSNAEMYGSFFKYLKDNSDFFLLLRERELFYLFKEVYLEKYGPKDDNKNIEAYIISFIQNGILGWVDEWINRGMEESADSMARLLSENGMK